MRVAFLGNQDNYAYRLAGWLRQQDIDAHVYMLRRDSATRSLPEMLDRELAGGPERWPGWLHEFDDTWPRSWMPIRNPAAEPIEREFDLVVTSGVFGLLVGRHFRSIPLVHMSLGSETTVLPTLLFRRGATLRQRWASLLAQRALCRTRAVTTAYAPAIASLSRLGHLGKTRLWGFPEVLAGNLKRVDQTLLAQLNERYSRYDLVFLSFSRLNFLKPGQPDYKAPERFLEAFRRIIQRDRANVRAVIGRHGHDVGEFHQLVVEQGLESHIDYVDHLPLWKLLTYLSIKSALVFDVPDAQHGTLGGLAREALSVGALLVKAIDQDTIDTVYGPGCPVISAVDAESCHAAMQRVLSMSPREREQYRETCRAWTAAHVDHPQGVRFILRLLRQILYGSRIEDKLQESRSDGETPEEHAARAVSRRRAA